MTKMNLKDIVRRICTATFPAFVFIWLLMALQVHASSTVFNFDIYTQEDGLPNNQIQCIYQDNNGWMWIGTSQGLSRFDGYNFVNFLPQADDSNSIKGNIVRVIRETSNGELLIGTENGGLNVFDREKEIFHHPLKDYPEFRFREVSVNALEEDKEGNLWIGTDFNLFVMDRAGNLNPVRPVDMDFTGNYVRNLKFDNDGNLWIGTNDGLFTYYPHTGQMNRFELPYKGNELNREIWEIYKDENGKLWTGTYSSGLFLVDPAALTYQTIKLMPEVERTETVRSISKGSFGEYWIGTRGGLYIYSNQTKVTEFFRHDQREPNSISNNSILSVFHDRKGETWIGTRGGLNLLAKSKQVFHSYGALTGNNRYLNSGTIYAFWIDSGNRIWIGTEDGGINIYDPSTERYEYMVADRSKRNTISQNCIKSFLDDKRGNLWVGTFLGGVDIIDLQTGEITNFSHDPDNYNSLSDNRVWDMALDRNGDIWIATSQGVDKYIWGEKRFEHFIQLFGNNQISWIEFDSKGNLWAGSADEVIIYDPEESTIKRFAEHSRAMLEDSQKRIWITTLDRGIATYSKNSGPVKYYGEDDGLANNQALCILEDEGGNLWVSTSNGLSKFDPENNYFQNFTSRDGLSNNQFCYGAAYKTHSGDMIFGTISGFNLFDPDEIVPAETDVPIVLTDFKIFNKPALIGEGKKSILTKSISETEHITLTYDQNVFTIEFAALNYVNTGKNLYSYMLEGFDKEWNDAGTNRSATYTNLDPGDYEFRVKRIVPGKNVDGNIRQLGISVLPPFWKTGWFLSLVFLFILTLIYILLRFFINREKIKNQLVLERVNARKLHELDMLKLKFFTNVSHEIRTPLTLILGPLDKIMTKENISKEEISDNLKLMHRNASNLNRLINQLLDFRKLEAGNLKLNLTEGDIVDFTRNVVNSFNDFAIEKQVTLKFNTLKKNLYTQFDPDKVEKILNNLLSNAFKFTVQGGTIAVNLSLIFDDDNDDYTLEDKEKQFIEIVVKDTGKGIPARNINQIFQRFTQLDDEKENSGTGIGLALVKELISLHRGKIFVNSKPGKGSKFTIHLPYLPYQKKTAPEPANIAETREEPEEAAIRLQPADPMHWNIMLIVEDNADVRRFISAHFHGKFSIVEAKNGDEGWKTALEVIPDIIISDVIMPNTDGYEMCRRIKNDERTSHIPVLLLTALHSKEHEIKGLTTGADDFITKPFDLSVLEIKVQNLLSIRNSLREKYSSTIVLEPTNVIVSSPDERFLNKAIEVVEENISDSDLDIESFAVKVGVSRMQLYRKLHALTNMTVKEFIRHIRLKRATQLLTQDKMNISEVAYEVGFKDLSHFRKCFKREYGMSATDYVAKMKQNRMTG